MVGIYNKPLVAAFWYRLYRCSDTDVEQLNFFYNLQMSQTTTTAGTDNGEHNQMNMHIGASEMGTYDSSLVSFDEMKLLNSKQLGIGGGDFASTFAKSVCFELDHLSARCVSLQKVFQA